MTPPCPGDGTAEPPDPLALLERALRGFAAEDPQLVARLLAEELGAPRRWTPHELAAEVMTVVRRAAAQDMSAGGAAGLIASCPVCDGSHMAHELADAIDELGLGDCAPIVDQAPDPDPAGRRIAFGPATPWALVRVTRHSFTRGGRPCVRYVFRLSDGERAVDLPPSTPSRLFMGYGAVCRMAARRGVDLPGREDSRRLTPWWRGVVREGLCGAIYVDGAPPR